MTINRVAVVVLNWNGVEIIGKCLDSLAEQSYRNYQIIVVDNGSKDNSKEVLTKYQSKLANKIHVIYNQKNSGFAGGVNIGIKYVLDNKFDAVALFNNDATADENWLSGLVEALNEHKEVGISTGLLLNDDKKTIDSTGDWYSVWGLAFPRFRDREVNAAPESGYVFGASGGASLYRTEMLKDVGLFDENFFAYYEDVDISFRAQLRGWKVFYIKSSVAYHERGITSSRIKGFDKYQMFKNLPMLLIKNVPKGLFLKIGIRFILIYFLMFINALFTGSFFPAIKGVFMSAYLSPSSISKRTNIQKNKRVDNEYIYSIIWKELPPTQKGRIAKFIKIFSLQ